MELKQKISSQTARIGIIGLGYVGLPLVLEFHKAGFTVTGFDVDDKKIEILKNKGNYIEHLNLDELFLENNHFTPTSNFSLLKEMDCILICVPTPLSRYREPDLSYVLNTTRNIAENLRSQQLIILESTTYPGTTDEEMLKILEAKGYKAGKDFFLAYSPEREDPNNKKFTTSTIPKVVGGYSPQCLELANSLYKKIVVETVPVSSTKVAEVSKLLENIYRCVNIALVNELKVLFDRMDIDVWEVIEASKTKPFGFQAFYPGPGLGGHCIPIDPFYLTWKAREYDIPTKFIELAGEVNTSMPYYVVDKVMLALNSKGKSICHAKILILGLAYKQDIDDVRESPAFKVIEVLENRGATVDYNDPYVKKTPAMRHYQIDKESIPLTEENLKSYDCIVAITGHSAYDPHFIVKHAQLIVDTRNLTRGISSEKIVKT